MNAKKILETISPQMTKAQILDLVQQAINDLPLLDKHDMAQRLSCTPSAVRAAAQRSDIGQRLEGSRGQRIFAPSDEARLRAIMPGRGGRPKR